MQSEGINAMPQSVLARSHVLRLMAMVSSDIVRLQECAQGSTPHDSQYVKDCRQQVRQLQEIHAALLSHSWMMRRPRGEVLRGE